MTLSLRASRPADLSLAVKLLENAELPVADVTAERLALVAESDTGLCGVIGREVFDSVALLRSLVVSEAARGQGVGKALVAELEAHCRNDGVQELWLLTIDAEAFFSSLGFHTRQRHAAPAVIQATEEFSSLCPGDAVLMSKQLAVAVPEDLLT